MNEKVMHLFATLIRSHHDSDFQFWNQIWQIHIAFLFVEVEKDKACCCQRKLKVSMASNKK
jgi:hypothetical protein